MLLKEIEIKIPVYKKKEGFLEYIAQNVMERLPAEETPVRFVITLTDSKNYHCELAVLTERDDFNYPIENSIFDFKKRNYENTNQFNAVLIIPTGIGAEIGGHAGDGGPVSILLAASCDNLITHPNVVNASDINELPENALYVEGSIISRLLMGSIGLQKVRSNRVMLVTDKNQDEFLNNASINSASAARAALGLNCPVVVRMNDRVLMRSLYSNAGRAVGQIEHFEYLLEVLEKYKSQFDAVALSTQIEMPDYYQVDYYREDMKDMVNPWGGVEAMLTHTISLMLNVPSAHSPMFSTREQLNLDVGIVDPRKSAETISTTFLHSVLKGLHKSPRIVPNRVLNDQPGILNIADISCLIIPDGCVGLPTLAAIEQNIPVIAVKENKNVMQNELEKLPFAPGKLFVVDNYLEAVGIMNAIKTGVTPESVRRPLERTTVKDISVTKKKRLQSDTGHQITSNKQKTIF